MKSCVGVMARTVSWLRDLPQTKPLQLHQAVLLANRYAVYLDAGYHHTCAILDNGRATCWGSDSNGQLGNGATTGDILSLHNGGLGWNAMAISAGGSHTCMQVDKPGDYNQHERIKCWGNRGSGQLGDNSNFALQM